MSKTNKNNLQKQTINSNPKDLIVAKKEGKLAIFDKENSVFITEHEYDRIHISLDGYHIVAKQRDLIEDDGTVLKNKGKTYYSAIVDNSGKVKELEDVIFSSYFGFQHRVCPAYIKSAKKMHLINVSGKILSEGFDSIGPVDIDNNFGLYRGIDFKKTKEGIRDAKKRVLIYKTGESLPYTFPTIKGRDGNKFVDNFIAEIKTVEDLKKSLKYGVNILKYIDGDIWDNAKAYDVVIKTLAKKYPEQVLIAIDFLRQMLRYHKITKTSNIKDITLEEIKLTNSIERKYFYKQIHDFYVDNLL